MPTSTTKIQRLYQNNKENNRQIEFNHPKLTTIPTNPTAQPITNFFNPSNNKKEKLPNLNQVHTIKCTTTVSKPINQSEENDNNINNQARPIIGEIDVPALQTNNKTSSRTTIYIYIYTLDRTI